jgi:flagellar biosynthesis/type III secretory pathway M-ring protein FliF/YscJ
MPEGVDLVLCRELIALVEREPERVAEQVRAWLMEDQT